MLPRGKARDLGCSKDRGISLRIYYYWMDKDLAQGTALPGPSKITSKMRQDF